MLRTAKWASVALLGLLLAACGPSSPVQTVPDAQTQTVDSQAADTQARSAGRVQALTLPVSTPRQLVSAGVTSFAAGAVGSGELQIPEFSPIELPEPNVASGARSATPLARHQTVNRRLPGTVFPGSYGGPSLRKISPDLSRRPRQNPVLGVHFDGLNLRDQRTANGGNQFTVEPPDQALCAGNGYVLESVNDVLRVYNTSGQARTGVVDLNTFYRYPPAINRQTGAYGPSITDPVCLYDQPTRRWFHVVLTLDTDPVTGNLTGSNHLDIAVSQTADPTGNWNIFKLAVQDDGSQGTPVHPNCPCLGDYPHIGADENGVYLTTNEFPFAGGFNGAQIYALSKEALARGRSTVPVAQFDLTGSTVPAFTVWPATSPGDSYEQAARGTEYFLSSLAVFSNDGTSNELAVWALTNTRSLDRERENEDRSKGIPTPNLALNASTFTVETYSVPPAATQKAGDFPLGQCLNAPACAARILGQPDPFAPETLDLLDGNDSRMQQVTYADGRLWGALDTAVNDNGVNRVGIAWYVLKPRIKQGSVSASVVVQGTLSAPGNSVTRPALAVTESGRGVMGYTLVGDAHYPSAGYTGIDAVSGAGDIQVAAEGKGPQDGFTGYKVFGGPPARWGDYGAAAADGKTIWIANEYVAQTCTLAQYTAAPFGSCGGTRVTLGNWATHISAVRP